MFAKSVVLVILNQELSLGSKVLDGLLGGLLSLDQGLSSWEGLREEPLDPLAGGRDNIPLGDTEMRPRVETFYKVF